MSEQIGAVQPIPAGDWTSATKISPDGTRRVFTRRLGRYQCVLLAVFAGLLAIGPTQPLAVADPTACRVVAAIILAAGAALCVLVLRRRVVVDGDHIEVRNMLYRWSARACDLTSFSPPPAYGKIRFHTGIAAHCRDGRTRYADMFGNSPVTGKAGSVECVELNDWLDAINGNLPTRVLHLRPVSGLTRSARRISTTVAVFLVLAFFGFGLPAVIDPSSLAH